MIECTIIEIAGEQASQGLGKWCFLYPPQIGEIIQIQGPAPSRDFYEVVKIEHWPVRPEAERSPVARPTPYVMVYVRWAYDEEVD